MLKPYRLQTFASYIVLGKYLPLHIDMYVIVCIYVVCYSASHAIQKSRHTISTVQSDVFPSELQFLCCQAAVIIGALCHWQACAVPMYTLACQCISPSSQTKRTVHRSLLNATRRPRYQGHEFNEAFLYHSKRTNWHTTSFFKPVDLRAWTNLLKPEHKICFKWARRQDLPKQTEGQTKFRLQK